MQCQRWSSRGAGACCRHHLVLVLGFDAGGLGSGGEGDNHCFYWLSQSGSMSAEAMGNTSVEAAQAELETLRKLHLVERSGDGPWRVASYGRSLLERPASDSEDCTEVRS